MRIKRAIARALSLVLILSTVFSNNMFVRAAEGQQPANGTIRVTIEGNGRVDIDFYKSVENGDPELLNSNRHSISESTDITIPEEATSVKVSAIASPNYVLGSVTGLTTNASAVASPSGDTVAVSVSNGYLLGVTFTASGDDVSSNNNNENNNNNSNGVITMRCQDNNIAGGHVSYSFDGTNYTNLAENSDPASYGTVTITSGKTVVYFKFEPNSGYVLDTGRGVAVRKAGEQNATNCTENEGVYSYTLPENPLTYAYELEFGWQSAGGGANHKVDIHGTNDLGDRVSVKVSIDNGATWSDYAPNMFDSATEGTTFKLKLVVADGYKVDNVSLRYYPYGEGSPVDYKFLNSISTSALISALTSDGYEVSYKPEADSQNAGDVSSLSANDTTLRIEYRTAVSYAESVAISMFFQTKNEESYGDWSTVGGQDTFVDGVGANEIEFKFNGNDYGGQGDPAQLGYGVSNTGESPVSVTYKSAFAGNTGNTKTYTPVKYDGFTAGGYTSGDNKNVLYIPDYDGLIDEVYVSTDTTFEDSEKVTSAPKTEGVMTFNVYEKTLDASSAYYVLIRRHNSTRVSLKWSYTCSPSEDYYVDHGKIYIEQVKRGDDVLFQAKLNNGELVLGENQIPETTTDTLGRDYSVDSSNGEVFVEVGDKVTVRLVPDYGYQIKEAKLNGWQTLTANAARSSFTFTANGNLHLAGNFVKASDIIDKSNASKVTSASIASGENATDTGVLGLTIADNSTYTDDKKASAKTAAGDGDAVSVATIDMDLTSKVSKGDGNYWDESITEFDNPISVKIKINDSTMQEGQTYVVVREHNNEFEKVNATYTNGTLTIPTNKFSTFSIYKVSGETPTKALYVEQGIYENNVGAANRFSIDNGALFTAKTVWEPCPDHAIFAIRGYDISSNNGFVIDFNKVYAEGETKPVTDETSGKGSNPSKMTFETIGNVSFNNLTYSVARIKDYDAIGEYTFVYKNDDYTDYFTVDVYLSPVGVYSSTEKEVSSLESSICPADEAGRKHYLIVDNNYTFTENDVEIFYYNNNVKKALNLSDCLKAYTVENNTVYFKEVPGVSSDYKVYEFVFEQKDSYSEDMPDWISTLDMEFAPRDSQERPVKSHIRVFTTPTVLEGVFANKGANGFYVTDNSSFSNFEYDVSDNNKIYTVIALADAERDADGNYVISHVYNKSEVNLYKADTHWDNAAGKDVIDRWTSVIISQYEDVTDEDGQRGIRILSEEQGFYAFSLKKYSSEAGYPEEFMYQFTLFEKSGNVMFSRKGEAGSWKNQWTLDGDVSSDYKTFYLAQTVYDDWDPGYVIDFASAEFKTYKYVWDNENQCEKPVELTSGEIITYNSSTKSFTVDTVGELQIEVKVKVTSPSEGVYWYETYAFNVYGPDIFTITTDSNVKEENDGGFIYYTFSGAGQSFSITPADGLSNYSLFILSSGLGYGADGNKNNYYLLADTNAKTDKLKYVYPRYNAQGEFATEGDPIDETFILNHASVGEFNDAVTLTTTAKAHGGFVLYIKYKLKGSNDYFVDTYQFWDRRTSGESYARADGVELRDKDDDNNYVGFTATVISKEEFMNQDYDCFDVTRKAIYSYSDNMLGAIDLLLEYLNEHPEDNDGYIMVQQSFYIDDAASYNAAHAEQYVSTAALESGSINGILFNCSAYEYKQTVAPIKDAQENNIYLRSNNGGCDVTWPVQLKHLTNVADPDDVIYGFEPMTYDEEEGWVEGRSVILLSGTPMTGPDDASGGLKIIDGTVKTLVYNATTKQYELHLNGKTYSDYKWFAIQDYLPVIHIDATTEVHLNGSFAPVPTGEPNILLKAADNVKLVVNGNVYDGTTPKGTYSKSGTYTNWTMGTLSYSYTVSLDTLEASTSAEFASDSNIKEAEVEINTDNLADQLLENASGNETKLSVAEKALYDKGSALVVKMNIADSEETDSDFMDDVSGELSGLVNTSVQYVDIDYTYQVGYENDAASVHNITETKEGVTITIKVADDFVPSGNTLYVFRSHNGVTEKIPATYNAATKTVSFTTNKFSEYGIASAKELEPAATPAAPSIASDNVTYNSVTITVPNDGKTYAFKCGADGQWQSSAEFSGLLPNKSYSFYQKVVSDMSTYGDSASSAANNITTKKQDISSATVTPEYVSVVYSNEDKMPSVTVTIAEKTLLLTTDYTVSYSEDVRNVGDKTIIVTGTGDYTGTATATYKITKANQAALTFEDLEATYGDADIDLTGKATGGSGDGTVTYSVPENNGVATISGTTLTITGAGEVTITATKAASDNYEEKTASCKLIVAKKSLTPSVSGTAEKVYDGTTTVAQGALVGIALDGIVSPDEVMVTGATYTYSSANVGDNIMITAKNFSLSGAKAANYVLSATTATGNVGKITPATATVTLGNLNQKSNAISAVTATLSPASADAVVTIEYKALKTPAKAAVEAKPCKYENGHLADCAHSVSENDTCNCGYTESHVHNSACGYVAAQAAVAAEYEWVSTVPTAVGEYPVRAYVSNGGTNLVTKTEDDAVTGTLKITQYVAPPASDNTDSGASDSNSSDNSTSSSDSSSSSNTATATAEAKVEVAKTTEKVGNITTVVPSKDPVTIQGKPNEIEKVQEKESSSDKDGHDEEISAWEKRLNEAQNEGKLLVDFGDIGRATFESEEEYVWNAINEAINSQTPSSSNGKEEKQTVQIEMAGVTEVPASLFETIKGRDVTVELNMCEGISWTINGQDVNNIDFSSINLEVKMDNGDIPDDKTKELAGDKATLNLSLSHDGEFGFNATLTVDVGKENAGQYANLYYFNPVTGEYEYRTSGNIDSNGKTPLGFGHASDYTIVIDTVSHEAANAAAATMAGVAVPGGFDWPLLLIGIGVMVLAIVVIVLLKSKKMSKQ